MKNLKQLLYDSFTYRNPASPCCQPFIQDGKLCSTNGKMLIRIDKNLVSAEDNLPMGIIEKQRNVPITKAVIHQPETCTPLTKDELEKAVKKAKIVEEYVPCDDCCGGGTVTWEYYSLDGCRYTKELECPVCDGTGHKEATGRRIPDPKQVYKLSKTYFKGDSIGVLIKTMEMLEVDKLFIRYLNDSLMQLTMDETDSVEVVIATVAEPEKFRYIIKIPCSLQ